MRQARPALAEYRSLPQSFSMIILPSCFGCVQPKQGNALPKTRQGKIA
jgi:hypothetical protein